MQEKKEVRKKDYKTKKIEADEFYKSISIVRCPAFGDECVHFTSEGFNHLVYKTAKKPRDERVQIMKFELLRKAKFLLETTTTFQEYEEEYQYVRVNRRGKYVNENTLVRAWGFVAVINKFRLKVVVRQVGNGKKDFFSVIPAWITRQYRDIKIIHTAPTGGVCMEDEDEILKNATSSDGS